MRAKENQSTEMPEEQKTFTVRIEPLGKEFAAPETITLLEAASIANLHLPRMCRTGTCRTCLCKLKSGSVRYTIDWPGVSAEEKSEGYILPCVAVAQSDLIIEAPDAADAKEPTPQNRPPRW